MQKKDWHQSARSSHCHSEKNSAVYHWSSKKWIPIRCGLLLFSLRNNIDHAADALPIIFAEGVVITSIFEIAVPEIPAMLL